MNKVLPIFYRTEILKKYASVWKNLFVFPYKVIEKEVFFYFTPKSNVENFKLFFSKFFENYSYKLLEINDVFLELCFFNMDKKFTELEDIFIESFSEDSSDISSIINKDNYFINFSKFKNTTKKTQINLDSLKKIIINLKLISNLDIREKHFFQSGSFCLFFEKEIPIRVSFHTTIWGEVFSIRILNKDFKEKVKQDFLKSIKKGGLTIIAGETGSGKTTLFYKILNTLKEDFNIISLEDPVEIPLSGILQSDVEQIGYEEGIKSSMRQNPHIICIGEIRDKISAEALLKSVLSGHLTITTIHANEKTLFSRLENLGCSKELIESTINTVIFMKNFKINVVEYLKE